MGALLSERTFPLEGNGNGSEVYAVSFFPGVRKDFPVGREWKHNSRRADIFKSDAFVSERTFPLEGNGNLTLLRDSDKTWFYRPKGLSRWKGMETTDLHAVWLEIKQSCPKGLSRWKGMETFSLFNHCDNIFNVRKDFPVGREWKRKANQPRWLIPESWSERTFPLEGNGNPVYSIPRFSLYLGPKGLSRWKGMETWLLWSLP